MSEGNLYKFWQGQCDTLVLPKGEEQLARLRELSPEFRFNKIYSSDLYRARCTAEAVSYANNIPIEYDRRLREINLGEMETMPWANSRCDMPETFNMFKTDYINFKAPGGESNMDVCRRVKELIDTVARKHENENIAIVSHGGAIKAYLINYAVNFDTIPPLSSNAAMTYAVYEDGKVTITDIDDRACTGLSDPNAKNGVDLYFKNVDYSRDYREIYECGSDSWYAIYGNLNEYDPENFLRNVKGIIEADHESGFIVYDGNTAAGMLLLDTRQRDEQGVGHIALVYLKPDYRHKGIGAQLIGKAIMFYREKGKDTLRLNVARCNKTAQTFYKKHGFEFTQKSRYTLSRTLVMKKNIKVPKLI